LPLLPKKLPQGEFQIVWKDKIFHVVKEDKLVRIKAYQLEGILVPTPSFLPLSAPRLEALLEKIFLEA
jgi:hypothetical protein